MVERSASEAPTAVRLIGAPTDIGASMRGATLGPDALRVAGLPHALQQLGLVIGSGDLLVGNRNVWMFNFIFCNDARKG